MKQSCRNIVKILKPEFPKINVCGVCLAQNPSESGIEFTKDALSYLEASSGPKKSPEHRTDGERLSFRVSKGVKQRFLKRSNQRGMNLKTYLLYLLIEDEKREINGKR